MEALKRLQLESKPFPPEVLVALVLKDYTAVNINYFEGLKLLVSWLGPIDKVDPSYDKYKYHRYVGSYRTQEAAKILSGKTYGTLFHRYHNLIIQQAITHEY